jgi:hypothetical protein
MEDQKGPSFIIGNIAKGADFWNREKEIKAIWEILEKNNVLLKAPRRFGKSSIMNDLFEHPSLSFSVFFQDTEKLSEPEEFITSIISQMLEKSFFQKHFQTFSKTMNDLVSRIEVSVGYEEMPEVRMKIKESLRTNWKEEGRNLIGHLKSYNERVLFILDELPELIKNIVRQRGKNTAIDFLQWFRSIRQMPELSNIRWLVGGSIGIEHLLEKLGAGTKTINDFFAFRVEPLSIDDGRALITALLKKEGQIKRIGDPILDKIMDAIGPPVPYFIQILLRESLYEMDKQKKKSLSKEIIDKAYNENVLGPTSRSYFEHYYERLKEYYDPDIEAIAKRLLTEIARKYEVRKTELVKLFNQISKGKFDADDFNYLMSDLENDFYISYKRETDSYYFTLKILRDWWLRYYDLVEEKS